MSSVSKVAIIVCSEAPVPCIDTPTLFVVANINAPFAPMEGRVMSHVTCAVHSSFAQLLQGQKGNPGCSNSIFNTLYWVSRQGFISLSRVGRIKDCPQLKLKAPSAGRKEKHGDTWRIPRGCWKPTAADSKG